MRRFVLLPMLILTLGVSACEDVTGIGSRSTDGEWSARIDGEDVWISLRDDRGEIRGSGEWGYDDVVLYGERRDDDVFLVFDFDDFNPVELDGVVRNDEIEGRLRGSGYDGERVVFRRDRYR